MNIPQVKIRLMLEAKKQGKIVERELKQTVSTWTGAKPKFESLAEVSGGDIVVITGPTGSTKAVNKFRWLDEGTKRRWAVMSNNWRSKTRPGSFKSRTGSGRVLIAGRRAMSNRNIGVRSGIKARKWTSTLQKRRTKPFTIAMIKAKNRGLRNIYK